MVEWTKLCSEVSKLRLSRRRGADVVPVHAHVDHAPGDVVQTS